MKITPDIRYIGVNDHQVDLFEGQYVVPNGMSYNSYAILDDKIAIMDTVDVRFTHEWLDNIRDTLNGRTPDYLIVQHMEPDHSANILNFAKTYPNAIIVSSQKSFTMMKNFFGTDFADRRMVVGEGDTLSLGKHTLAFVTAPMVHWPEVMVTYDETDKVLFSADGFGRFGALDKEDEWETEARRYYFGIVGKYGIQVNHLLRKLEGKEIRYICSLHGPVLKDKVAAYIQLYQKWASYEPEEEGIVIAYSSVYGNTKKAVLFLEEALRTQGCQKILIYDLARSDMSTVVAQAFRFDKLVLATTTYNGGLFPAMREFINHLTEREFQNRTLALIENGSWASMAGKLMRDKFEKSKNIRFVEPFVKITSVMDEANKKELTMLADKLSK